MRVKRSVTARARHKSTLAAAKGMQHNRTRSFRLAKQAVIRALQYAYRDRRNKKRTIRSLWITRINAAARENGTTYGKLISSLRASGVELDRKVLAELAVNDPKAFSSLVKSVSK
ncbi:ribosomal protein L20 [Candidatus Saccharimonas aalborgensis]|uniref:Large ribosomal subunit protein bL20 n=1 Tax=Candidatus Saccharimonas aalborgensis TaxID=1332188 RepID=R4PVV2_9BACT|nr:50S ribosomal protein L20 [Candidatus Saccharimonas aalborgensis]AGL62385.1 ribosomal protein L20 [Candidatus Saccharimonas aalborgensis]QQS68884.1 MAG: 50S ribosomal protein L20 [Candidatus Saccharibacteria bacterium]